MIKSAEQFVELIESTDPKCYRRAATEEAPEAVWMEIIERFPEMRFWVASNKTVPMNVLAFLVSDPEARVRSMVASKRKLQLDLQEILAKDEEESVRYALVHNESTDFRVLELLERDVWPEVSNKAKANLKLLRQQNRER